jgi:superfamily II DNA or RNA helicase
MINPEIPQKTEERKLYPYQEKAINQIVEKLNERPDDFKLLYQLPTGGGKTIIFSEIARYFNNVKNKRVLILTHRVELLEQTSARLKDISVKNFIINSEIRKIENQNEYNCFVAMVETLNNRLLEDDNFIGNIGLVIIDEAHNNSFRKIFQYFRNSILLGVTATPLSSNKSLPLKDNYNELITGDSIHSLIADGYLCEPSTYTYDVNLGSLKVGINGDYTVSSSEKLYSGYDMQFKLISAYKEKALGKKTLIFNPGIQVSWLVYDFFKEAGITNIKHLDSTFGEKERREVLDWFRNTPGAILTSVGILTTGFDEPSVEVIVVNRATRSLTLYHQMIGRGSRVTPTKKNFTIIDLGNNVHRFGLWEMEIDWVDVFAHPDKYLEQEYFDEIERQRELTYNMPEEIRSRFSNSLDLLSFPVVDLYEEYVSMGIKPNRIIDDCIQNHADVIKLNAKTFEEAKEMQALLQESIKNRIKLYTSCLTKSSNNYFNWLLETYNRKLRNQLRIVVEEND